MPWTLIFNLVLKILGFGLDRMKADAAAKRAFYDFVTTLNDHGLASYRLHQADQEQFDELERRREEERKLREEGPPVVG